MSTVSVKGIEMTVEERQQIMKNLDLTSQMLPYARPEAIYDELIKIRTEKKNQSKVCIFEKRYCRFANNIGKAFDCSCPSDDEMPCNK